MRTMRTLEALRPVNAAASRPPGSVAMEGMGRVTPRQVPGPGARMGRALAQAGASSKKTGRK